MFILATFIVKTSDVAAKAPEPFQDSGIKRQLKDGKVQKFDGNKYKIVRRGVKTKPKVVTKKAKVKKNRVSLLAGVSPTGHLDRSGNKVSTERSLSVGLQYQRLVTDKFNVGIQVQTNESVLGSVGFDF